MKMLLGALGTTLLMVALGSTAQTNTFPSTGNAGIGTTSPQYPLDVTGAAIRVSSGNTARGSGELFLQRGTADLDAAGISFGPYGATSDWFVGTQYDGGGGTAGNFAIAKTDQNHNGGGTLISPPLFTIIPSGKVGIGSSAPMGMFDVAGIGGLVVSGVNLDPAGGYSLTPLESSGRLLTGWNRSAGGGEIDLISNRGLGGTGGFNFYDYTNSGVLNLLMSVAGTGNLSIKGPITFPDGSNQSTAWTGVLCGGDYAESVDVTGDRHQYGPGDVLQIDDQDPSKFVRVAEPYSTGVAGVFSTRPGALGRRQTTPKSPDELPLAMIGIVPVKVTAENGAIHPRDLLVSSSTPGYAMKGTDRNRLVGAVIGKAMGSLDKGEGVIEVLVTLQ